MHLLGMSANGRVISGLAGQERRSYFVSCCSNSGQTRVRSDCLLSAEIAARKIISVVDHESELLDHRLPFAFFAPDILHVFRWRAGDWIAAGIK
jgi:hypothetical protein